MRMQSFRVVVAAAAACAVAAPSFAGDLNPPGAPGPTMKPLDVVEARTPIFAADFPLTINQPGSYYLAENVSGPSGGISITASNVTIDLNGFALSNGSGTAISDVGGLSSVTVKNGTILGWSSGGIVLDGTQGARVHDVSTRSNGAQGIWIGSGVVRDCTSSNDVTGGFTSSYAIAVGEGVIDACAVIDSNGSGAWIGGHGVLRNSTINNVAGNGVLLGVGSTMTDSTVRDALGDGVDTASGCTITNVSVYNAGEDGIDADDGATITSCAVRFCAANGIFVRGGATVQNSTATSCGNGITAGAGFRSEGAGNRLDSNNASNCNRGFYITAQGDFMIRNTARNCAVGYQQTGTNVYGTIISSNYSPISTTNPWVNFEIF